MAFTAYIFQEDYDRLITKEVIHAAYSQQQKGGSLFGQWTSTGNPVIHRVMPFSSPSQGTASRDVLARDLYEGFRVCYIGEWRPVQHHNYNYMHTRESREEREARERLQGREAPARFLVLDVSNKDIVPFLLNRQTARQESGKLERLSGKNPFNKTETLQQSMPRRDNYQDPLRYPSVQAGQPDLSHHVPRASQFQEATTTVPQWYSGDEGNKKLQKVLQGIKEIAFRGDVAMTRDKRSEDISLSLVDNLYRKKWEIRFPGNFPAKGALLVKNPETYNEKQRSLTGFSTENQAVKSIVSWIKSSSF